jgi:nitroreductase
MDGDGVAVGVLERMTAGGEPAADPAVGPEIPLGPDAGVMAIMATTRAMRRLRPDPVPDELLRRVIEAATWAPSANNWQVAAFLVVTDREIVRRLAVPWRRVIADYFEILDAAGLVDAADDGQARMIAAIDYQRDHFEETPALVVVCQDSRGLGPSSRSPSATIWRLARTAGPRRAVQLLRAWQHLSTGAAGAAFYPAVQNLLLAARAHGLAACMTTWHLLAEEEFKAILEIPDDVRIWAVVPIGWPVGRFGAVRRRPLDEVIHRERW